jgi:hypothetical protein
VQRLGCLQTEIMQDMINDEQIQICIVADTLDIQIFTFSLLPHFNDAFLTNFWHFHLVQSCDPRKICFNRE